MTNLLQKLKPEIQELINKDLLEYPTSTTILINELTSTYFMNELKYFCILDIESYFRKISFYSTWLNIGDFDSKFCEF